jgi:hypothetical protein
VILLHCTAPTQLLQCSTSPLPPFLGQCQTTGQAERKVRCGSAGASLLAGLMDAGVAGTHPTQVEAGAAVQDEPHPSSRPTAAQPTGKHTASFHARVCPLVVHIPLASNCFTAYSAARLCSRLAYGWNLNPLKAYMNYMREQKLWSNVSCARPLKACAVHSLVCSIASLHLFNGHQST